jgi:hypothetical protein
MINGNACFAYFNKNWGIPATRQSAGYLILINAGAAP